MVIFSIQHSNGHTVQLAESVAQPSEQAFINKIIHSFIDSPQRPKIAGVNATLPASAGPTQHCNLE